MLNQIFRSELKLKIITALTESKTVRELTDEIYKDLPAKYKRKRRGAMHSAVKALKRLDIVYEDEKGNNLTAFGKIFRNRIIELNELINTFKKHREFWQSHSIDAIPEPFLNGVHVLVNSELVYSKSDPYLPRKVILQEVKNAEKELYYLTSVIELEWTLATLDRVDHGVNTKGVIDNIMWKKISTAKGFKEVFQRRLNRPNYELRILDEIPFAMLVTEKTIMFAFPDVETRTLDFTQTLLCRNPDTIKWGKALYHYMLERAKPVITPAEQK
ncbi:MAG: transcriptional regulator FilR1 domain-containing protein [Candidatus Thermoplasmatota archaeon]